MSAFAETLAEKCVSEHLDEKGGGYVHLRNRAGAAVISVGLRAVHRPEAKALEFVRSAVAGFVEAGIEEGRRWQSVSPEALAAAREEGRRAGWAEALAVVNGQVEKREETLELAKRELAQARAELDAVKIAAGAVMAATPEGGQ